MAGSKTQGALVWFERTADGAVFAAHEGTPEHQMMAVRDRDEFKPTRRPSSGKAAAKDAEK